MRSLDDIIAAYLSARDAGNAPPPEAWLEANPDHADELVVFLADMRSAGGWVEAFALGDDVAATPRSDPLPTRAPGSTDVIRYFGDYEISGEIARGGMGIVYRARQLSLNRPVALKMIAPALLQNESSVRRFRFEAEAAAALDHPGIVPIYEIGEHEGQYYFSMQLVAGLGLDVQAARYVGRPAAGAALLRDIAEAVAHGHRRGVLHRDLKPGNILVDDDGNPHVTDFGLAKRLDADDGLTRTGELMGTPTHMAPEQAVGGEVTTATDVWSLGVVLYELLAGRVPFRGSNLLETIRLLKEESPVPPRRERSDVPLDLETICLKCLEKDPTRRYADAGELSEELQRYIDGEPILARPVGALERGTMWARRKPAAAALVAAAALAFVALVMGALWLAQYQAGVADSERDLRREADDQRDRADGLRVRADERARKARELAYASSMALAAVAWERGDVLSLDGLLAKYGPDSEDPDRRGFVWHFLKQRRTDAQVFASRGGYVVRGSDALLTPARAEAEWVAFRDPATGRVLSEVRAYDDVTGLPRAFGSADGSTAVTAGAEYDGKRSFFRVRVWDMAARRLAGAYEVEGGQYAAFCLSEDGARLAVYHYQPRRISILEARSGKVLHTIDDFVQAGSMRLVDERLEYIRTVKRDGRHRLAIVRRPLGGKAEVTLSDFEFPVAWNELSVVTWSPDGAWIGLGAYDGTVALIEGASGTTRHSRRLHDGYVHALAFSEDGTWLASGSNDGLTHRTHVRTGRAAPPLRATGAPVRGLAFLDEGGLAGATADDVLLWDPGARPADWQLEHTFLRGVLACDGGDRPALALCVSDDLTIRAAHQGGSLRPLTTRDRGGRVAATIDGRRFAVLGFKGVLDLWNAGEDAAYRTIDLALDDEKAVELAISPAGDVVAVGQIDFGVRFFDAETGAERAVWKHAGAGQGRMVFSPDGRTLAVCGMEDVPLSLIDVATATRTSQFGPRETWHRSPVFSRDGRLFATICRPTRSIPARVTVWRTDTWEPVSQSTRELEDTEVIVFNPDGRTLAAGRRNGEVFLVDVPTGIEMLAYDAHAAPVGALCFSPDGRTLWTAGGKQIRAWRGD